MRWQTLAACGVCVLGGALANQTLRDEKPTTQAQNETERATAVGARVANTPQAERATNVVLMREVVREELSAALAKPAPTTSSSTSDGGSAPPLASSAAPMDDGLEGPSPAYIRAQSLIQDAIARKSWTDEDREGLSAVLGDMSPDERLEAMREVIRAANEGKLRANMTGLSLF